MATPAVVLAPIFSIVPPTGSRSCSDACKEVALSHIRNQVLRYLIISQISGVYVSSMADGPTGRVRSSVKFLYRLSKLEYTRKFGNPTTRNLNHRRNSLPQKCHSWKS